MPKTIKTDRCRCGVYEYIHRNDQGCGNYRKAGRLRLWYRDHYLWRHIAGWLWIHVPTRLRWRIVSAFYRDGVCWCDLVDSAYKPDHFRDDWREPNGCLCDVPLPTDAGEPGECYCSPPQEVS